MAGQTKKKLGVAEELINSGLQSLGLTTYSRFRLAHGEISSLRNELSRAKTELSRAKAELAQVGTELSRARTEFSELRKKNSILSEVNILSAEMRPEHLRKMEDEDAARALFKQSIEMVEIEVFSYCNRVCWFCPNAKHDRRSKNHYMDREVYLSILRQLRSCNYDRKISYSRYNEPLADRIILERISEAREYLPDANLHLNTNGDYLTKEYLEDLYGAGLRSINIQAYLNNNEKYQHEKVRTRIIRKAESLNIPYKIVRDQQDTWLEISMSYKDMTIRMYGRNFDRNGTDRGGTVEVENQHIRHSPCRSPFYHMYIDYNGAVMPCCNVRSDIPEHAGCAMGKIKQDTSIFLTYTNARAAGWRRSLVGFEEKAGVCKNCNFNEFSDTPETRRAQDGLLLLAKDIEAARK